MITFVTANDFLALNHGTFKRFLLFNKVVNTYEI
jgi:hypothetical protein